jgi:excisionase family DNA binding protein
VSQVSIRMRAAAKPGEEPSRIPAVARVENSHETRRRTMSMRMEAYMTVAEAAAALRVSDETVQRACRTGELEHGRVGRAIRIPRAAFQAWERARLERPAKVAVVRENDVELSALVEAWLKDMAIGARPLAADTIRTHRKSMAKYVRTLLGAGPAATLTWGEAATERALGRAVASLPVTQFATRYNLYMAVMSWTSRPSSRPSRRSSCTPRPAPFR